MSLATNNPINGVQATGPPPRKRTRASEPESSEPERAYQNDAEFWLEDGTVILATRDTRFCIYKGVLAEHSPVFSDMFSMPQPNPPASGGVASEGLPIVYLDDSPQDLRHVFRALLPRKKTTFIHTEQHTPKFSKIYAYARLGHKYRIDTLLEQALAYLKNHFTTDMDAWVSNNFLTPPHFSPVHAIAVVNIARLTGCDILLPPALAVCCTLSARELLRGFKRADGTRETLSPDDLERCINGSSSLMLASTKIVLSAFSPFHPEDCHTEDECQRGIRELLYSYKYHPDIVANDHPFGSWAMYSGGGGLSLADGDVHICGLCQEMLKERISSEQRLVWRNLPYHLGITVDEWKAKVKA